MKLIIVTDLHLTKLLSERAKYGKILTSISKSSQLYEIHKIFYTVKRGSFDESEELGRFKNRRE